MSDMVLLQWLAVTNINTQKKYSSLIFGDDRKMLLLLRYSFSVNILCMEHADNIRHDFIYYRAKLPIIKCFIIITNDARGQHSTRVEYESELKDCT